MTMKEQERKALEQIKKIVAGLGEDSYIGTAFEGCFEIAEENIENDFACSMKQRAEAAEKRAEHHKKEADRLKETAEETRKHAAGVEENLQKTEAAYEAQMQTLKDRLARVEAELAEATEAKVKYFRQSSDLTLQLSHMESENMKLKAKLFDLLFKD